MFKIADYYKKYPWKKTLVVIKQRCNNPNNERYYCYGEKGIKCKITVEELKELWFRDKAYDMEKPSIDRKNSDKDYTFSNCRYIELGENTSKRNRKYCKAILQYDLEGNFIKEWKSIKEATKNLKCSNITNVLKGRYKQDNGFIWRYKNE